MKNRPIPRGKMDIKCLKLKKFVDKEDCFCCVFYRERWDTDDKVYFVCDYENCNPSLRKKK